MAVLSQVCQTLICDVHYLVQKCISGLIIVFICKPGPLCFNVLKIIDSGSEITQMLSILTLTGDG